jgi:nitrile hydratase accessory protein
VSALPGQPYDAEGPVFREAWEAQAFALVILLHKQGLFTWKEWTLLLSDEIQNNEALGATYYQSWLLALERIIILKGIASQSAIKDLTEAWEHAALHTPHGKPIVAPAYQT